METMTFYSSLVPNICCLFLKGRNCLFLKGLDLLLFFEKNICRKLYDRAYDIQGERNLSGMELYFLKYISEHMIWSEKLKIKMSSAMYTAQKPEQLSVSKGRDLLHSLSCMQPSFLGRMGKREKVGMSDVTWNSIEYGMQQTGSFNKTWILFWTSWL